MVRTNHWMRAVQVVQLSASGSLASREVLTMRALAIGSVLGIGCVSLWPFGKERGTLIVVPFRDLVVHMPAPRAARWIAVQVGGNVAMYVPVGFFLPLVVPELDRLPRVVVAGVALSTAMETAQYTFPLGRVAATTDVLTNTAGVACGFLGLQAVRRSLGD